MNAREMHYPRDPLGAYDDGAEVVMPIAPASIEPPPPAQTLNTGDELADGAGGRFMILGLLGKGGMGEVHRAEWWKRGASEGEVVAIKVMLAKNADDPKAAMRFNAEGKALREIRHLNVVQVLATGIRKKDRLAWMAMDLLHGKTLQEILEQHGKLPVPWAIQIVRDVCNGLQAVHSIALHRDIKPQNLFLCTDGVIRILDLGASKLLHGGLVKTTTGFQVGTLSYMSPEHIQNTDLDGRSDLFSLTIVLYQLLTGYYPFDFFEGVLPGWFEVCSRIIDKPHIPPDHQRRAPWLPRYIVEILNKGLAKDRTKRFRNAKEMGQVLTAAMNQLAADVGEIEPLTTFAASLAPPQKAASELSEPKPRLVEPMPEPAEPMPRTTLPMSTPADALSTAAQSPPPALAFATTEKVPEPERNGMATGTWTRPTMLPEEVEVSRVSGITTKRPDPEIALPPAATEDKSDDDNKKRDPYTELLAAVITDLPEELRQPFVWSRVEKRPIDDIAEHLGLPAAIVHHRVLIAEAAVRAEMSLHFPSERSDEEPPPVEAEDTEARDVTALGPRGTVKMIESAATLLGRQGKTLEQVTPSAQRPRRHVAAVGLALALTLALTGASVVLYQSRSRLPALLGAAEPAVSATVAPSTTGTVAPSTTGTVAPSTTGTTTAAPPSIATVRPPTTVERGPSAVPPYRGEELPRRRYDRADPSPRASGRLFGTEP